MKKNQKKQYRPIAGQSWYEKLLDWTTREENCRWSVIGVWAYAALLLIGVYISANIINQPDIADMFMKIWLRFFPVAAVLAMINPLSGFWALRAEKKLQKTIKEHIGEYGRYSYDELLVQCMPVKIHLGIDGAVEKMLQNRELVQDEDGRFRLPVDEDRKKWREEDLAEFGYKISFEDLEKLFALDLKEQVENIDIEFSLGEHDGCRMGKTENICSGADIFWLMAAAGERFDFTTFQEMTEANLFDGQSLKSAWDNVILMPGSGQDT